MAGVELAAANEPPLAASDLGALPSGRRPQAPPAFHLLLVRAPTSDQGDRQEIESCIDFRSPRLGSFFPLPAPGRIWLIHPHVKCQ